MRPQNAMIDMLHTRICVLNTWYFTGNTGKWLEKWMKTVVIRVWWLVVSPSKNLVHLGSLLLTFYPKKLLNPASIFRWSKDGILLLHWLNVDHSHLPEKFLDSTTMIRWSYDPTRIFSLQDGQLMAPETIINSTSTEGLPPETRRWSSVPWGRRVCRRPHQSWERKIWSSMVKWVKH